MRFVRYCCYSVAMVRFAFSALFSLAPDRMMTRLFGTTEPSPRTRAVAAQYAARDLALGVGLWRALRRRRHARAWMLAGTAADLADLVAVAAAADGGAGRGRRAMTAGMCGIVAADALLAAKVGAADTAAPAPRTGR